MNDSYDLRGSELHIEVHKFRTGAIIGSLLLVLFLQAFLPLYVPKAEILDLPLLITIYFGLSRRNPSTGLLLGMAIGLAQDSLSGPTVQLGLYGIAKTIVGYLASSIGARRILLAQPETWFNMRLFVAALVNALVAVFLFLLLDRLRKR